MRHDARSELSFTLDRKVLYSLHVELHHSGRCFVHHQRSQPVSQPASHHPTHPFSIELFSFRTQPAINCQTV